MALGDELRDVAAHASTNGYAEVDTATTMACLGAAATASGATVWASNAIATTGPPDRAIRTLFAIDLPGAPRTGVLPPQ